MLCKSTNSSTNKTLSTRKPQGEVLHELGPIPGSTLERKKAQAALSYPLQPTSTEESPCSCQRPIAKGGGELNKIIYGRTSKDNYQIVILRSASRSVSQHTPITQPTNKHSNNSNTTQHSSNNKQQQ